MAFYMYILRSASTGRYYVGHTQDLRARLQEHNLGRAPATRDRGPWELFYDEEFSSRSEASRRERHVKRMKSRAWIERLAGASR